MATGFWHLSSTMMFDQIGQPAGGANAWFYPADTLTQLTVYRDSGLTIPWTQPVAADGFGRMPNVYLDGSAASYYRFRVTDDAGVELIALATVPILVPGGSGGGGGGGGSVDATTILNTGDVWFSPVQNVRAGAVRMNGRTIGNALSGGTERANADCNALFLFLWQNLSDTVCPVSGGRTTAAADFAANKRIGLPDARGRSLFGLDGMGNSLAGVIPITAIAANDTPGSSGGSSLHNITVGEMPVHLHGVGTIVAANESAHTHGVGTYAVGSHTHGVAGITVGNESAHTHGVGSLVTGNDSPDHTHSINMSGLTVNVTSSGASAVMGSGLSATAGRSVPHTHTITGATAAGSAHSHSLSGNVDASTPSFSGTSAAGSAHTHALSGSTANAGTGTAMVNLAPALLGTWFIKL
jgi:hypothetical protein